MGHPCASHAAAAEIIPQNEAVEGFEVDHTFPDIGRKVMLLNARKVYREGNGT